MPQGHPIDPIAMPADVLAFWFGAPPLAPRKAWFAKDEAFDDAIRSRFGAAIAAALADSLPPAWRAAPLARIVVLDQFTRNVHRGSALAFAGDAQALAMAQALVASGSDRMLDPMQRVFAYMPCVHAEDIGAQDTAVRLFEALADDDARCADNLAYARRHRDVIRRYGRFPHRNAVLGRTSTAAELAFIATPGTAF